jgi:hypothetical protein
VIILILAIAGGFLLVPKLLPQTPGAVLTTVPPATTPITVQPTLIPTPASTPPSPSPTPTAVPQATVIIPQNGVWVRVNYTGLYHGNYGTPGALSPLSGTGEHFYMVSTVNGTVEVSVQKNDGSADELVIEVYKTGNLVKRATTAAPRGSIEFQVSLKPAPATTSPA